MREDFGAGARAKAREVISRYCIKSPEEINLENLAGCEYILIEEENSKGYQGRISFGEGYGLIKVNNQIKEEGQRRFVIAHELGHFFNEMRKNTGCTSKDLMKFNHSNDNEYRANIFASELLMHEPWITEYTSGKKPSIELLKDISNDFKVSVSAAGIRYTETGKYPTCIIMSKDGKVIWSSINKLFPFQFIKPNQPLNSYSSAYDYFQGKEISQEPEEILADAWFLNDYDYKPEYYLIEQNLVMKNYGCVLTMLWEV
jgi:Zn-dependent peptidase ImmA (M78 family)